MLTRLDAISYLITFKDLGPEHAATVVDRLLALGVTDLAVVELYNVGSV